MKSIPQLCLPIEKILNDYPQNIVAAAKIRRWLEDLTHVRSAADSSRIVISIV